MKSLASRIIHYAITKYIAEIIKIKDINRLYLGSILPDAYNLDTYNTASTTAQNSHYKETICNGTLKTYNLTKFRNQFINKMKEDDLYLGYYLHLVQDIIYRQFVYDDYKWNPTITGNVSKLHNDYHLINTYVIKKYELKNSIYIPEKFLEEEIFSIYPFGIEQLLHDLKEDFIHYSEGNIFFFTEKMADEYIKRASHICLQEVAAIKSGGVLLDEKQYAWLKK